MNKLIYCIIFMISCSSVFSNEEDSLKFEITKQKGLGKIKAIRDLASYYYSKNTELAFNYYRWGLNEAKKANEKHEIALCYTNIGALNSLIGEYKKALDTFELALKIFDTEKYRQGAIFTWSQIGTVYSKIGDYNTAAIKLTKALKYYEYSELMDSIKHFKTLNTPLSEDQNRLLNVHSIAYNDFGLLQYKLGYYSTALEAYQNSLVFAKALNRKDRIGASLSNIGDMYLALKNYKEAEKYFMQAIDLFKAYQHHKYLATSLLSLSKLYFERKNFEQASKVAKESLKYFKLINDSTHAAYTALGMIESELGNYSKSIQYFQEALVIANREQTAAQLLDNYSAIADMYEKKGDYRIALTYRKKYIQLNDSIFNIEKIEQLNKQLAFYQVNKKSDELKILKSDIELSKLKYDKQQQRIFWYFFVIVLFLILIVGLIVLLKSRNKINKIIAQKKEELEGLNTKLVQSNDTKDKFFSIIAHDLKNPLGSFYNISELLYDDYENFDEEERKEFLQILKKSSKQLFGLLENLLEWSRSQRGLIQYKPSQISINTIVQNCIDLNYSSAEKKHIKLLNLLSEEKFIWADPKLVQTIVRNLISNAIKFSKEDSSIEIGVIPESNDNKDVFFVKDYGIGMNKETIEKLFRIDQNITNIGTAGESGTGLGLILCMEFIQKQKGSIWVESEEEKGSTFYFSLPKVNDTL